jgi:hypothetical protein
MRTSFDGYRSLTRQMKSDGLPPVWSKTQPKEKGAGQSPDHDDRVEMVGGRMLTIPALAAGGAL